jgi:hypothetical protein
MLKNAILAFFNGPRAVHVRTRLRRIKHLLCLIRGETSLSRTSRLLFNSLLEYAPHRHAEESGRPCRPVRGESLAPPAVTRSGTGETGTGQ